jgi:hypothetical protein
LHNAYEVRGDITAIFIVKKDGTRLETLISTSDLEKVKAFKYAWCSKWDPVMESHYVMGRYLEDGVRKLVMLHRFLFDNPEGFVIDHINHDTLNNTRSNLRVVTFAENQMNRRGPRKDSKSGILGVSWDKKSKKWRSQIQRNGVKMHLGFYDDIKEAESIVKKVREEFKKKILEATNEQGERISKMS